MRFRFAYNAIAKNVVFTGERGEGEEQHKPISLSGHTRANTLEQLQLRMITFRNALPLRV